MSKVTGCLATRTKDGFLDLRLKIGARKIAAISRIRGRWPQPVSDTADKAKKGGPPARFCSMSTTKGHIPNLTGVMARARMKDLRLPSTVHTDTFRLRLEPSTSWSAGCAKRRKGSARRLTIALATLTEDGISGLDGQRLVLEDHGDDDVSDSPSSTSRMGRRHKYRLPSALTQLVYFYLEMRRADGSTRGRWVEGWLSGLLLLSAARSASRLECEGRLSLLEPTCCECGRSL